VLVRSPKAAVRARNLLIFFDIFRLSLL